MRTAPIEPLETPRPAPRRPGLAFFAAVLLAGANMRSVFSSLPPLLEGIRAELGLSAATAGLLTTAPVLCFGLLAPLAPTLVRRMPIERLVALCAVLTAVGAAARGIGGIAGLFAGTILAGAGVAVAQTAVPVLLRTRFAAQRGALTGAFSMALTLGAAIAAGLVVPLERALGSWQAALAAFALPAGAAAVVWLLPETRTVVARTQAFGLRNLARSWSLAAYFGLQSMGFYCGLTWLPAILEHEGWSEASAGGLQALTNAMQLVPAMVVPVLAVRLRHQRALLVTIVCVATGGLAGLLVAPELAVLWMAVIGLGQGGGLGMGLVLPVLRGAGAAAVAALTALTLSAGYLICAIGPPLVGLAHDLTDGWTVPLLLMIGITLSQILPGWRAAGSWTIGARDHD
jgi:CP family cyanate transporter-like MFS transporter